MMDTLAAAYAEAGEFAKAVAMQKRTVPYFERTLDMTPLARMLVRERLHCYEEGRAWHGLPPFE